MFNYFMAHSAHGCFHCYGFVAMFGLDGTVSTPLFDVR